jgi:hypothetical protein
LNQPTKPSVSRRPPLLMPLGIIECQMCNILCGSPLSGQPSGQEQWQETSKPERSGGGGGGSEAWSKPQLLQNLRQACFEPSMWAAAQCTRFFLNHERGRPQYCQTSSPNSSKPFPSHNPAHPTADRQQYATKIVGTMAIYRFHNLLRGQERGAHKEV